MDCLLKGLFCIGPDRMEDRIVTLRKKYRQVSLYGNILNTNLLTN